MRGHVPDPSGSSCSKQPQRDIRIAGCKVGIARNTGQGRRHRLLSHAGRHSGYTGFKLLLCLYLCGTNIASNPQKRGSVACPTAQLVTIDLFPMIHDGKSRKLPFDPAEAIAAFESLATRSWAHSSTKSANSNCASIRRPRPLSRSSNRSSISSCTARPQPPSIAAYASSSTATRLRSNCSTRRTNRCAPPASPATRSRRCATWPRRRSMEPCRRTRPFSRCPMLTSSSGSPKCAASVRGPSRCC